MFSLSHQILVLCGTVLCLVTWLICEQVILYFYEAHRNIIRVCYNKIVKCYDSFYCKYC